MQKRSKVKLLDKYYSGFDNPEKVILIESCPKIQAFTFAISMDCAVLHRME